MPEVIIKGDQESSLSVIVDEASATVTYVGQAEAGTDTASAFWRIKRVTESGSITTIEHADGDTKFDNIWDNRAVLSYS